MGEAAHRLGLYPSLSRFNLKAVVLPHLLTPVLYIGPLYIMYLSSTLPLQSKWTFQHDVVEKFTSWEGLRNFSLVSEPRPPLADPFANVFGPGTDNGRTSLPCLRSLCDEAFRCIYEANGVRWATLVWSRCVPGHLQPSLPVITDTSS